MFFISHRHYWKKKPLGSIQKIGVLKLPIFDIPLRHSCALLVIYFVGKIFVWVMYHSCCFFLFTFKQTPPFPANEFLEWPHMLPNPFSKYYYFSRIWLHQPYIALIQMCTDILESLERTFKLRYFIQQE